MVPRKAWLGWRERQDDHPSVASKSQATKERGERAIQTVIEKLNAGSTWAREACGDTVERRAGTVERLMVTSWVTSSAMATAKTHSSTIKQER